MGPLTPQICTDLRGSKFRVKKAEKNIACKFDHINFYGAVGMMGHKNVQSCCCVCLIVRPWSVDSLDGGATDVPILGPME